MITPLVVIVFLLLGFLLAMAGVPLWLAIIIVLVLALLVSSR